MTRALLGGVVVVLVLSGMTFFVVTDSFTSAEGGLNTWGFLTIGLASLAYSLVGMVLISRLPALSIGWLLTAGALSGGIALFVFAPARLPGLGNALTFLVIIAGIAVLALFPQGRPTSRGWTIALWVLAADAGVVLALELPAAVNAPGLVWAAFFYSTILIGAAAVVRLVRLYRNGELLVRQQLKWLVLVLVCGAILLLSSLFGTFREAHANDIAGVVLAVGGPVAIGLAVLKYRLYDIDRIISRTLGYALVVGGLGVVYALGAVWLPSQVAGDSVPPVFVAGSTLAVAALFNPVRKTFLGWADRRFYRSRYDADSVAEGFASRIREPVDVDTLASDWIDVVNQALRPSLVGVWLKERGRTS